MFERHPSEFAAHGLHSGRLCGGDTVGVRQVELGLDCDGVVHMLRAGIGSRRESAHCGCGAHPDVPGKGGGAGIGDAGACQNCEAGRRIHVYRPGFVYRKARNYVMVRRDIPERVGGDY